MSGFSPQTSQREYPSWVENISPLASPSEPTRTEWIMPEREQGTFRALDLMAACVRGECPPDYSGYQDQFNYRVATTVVGNLDERVSDNTDRAVAALYVFVRDQIAYLDHPPGEQVVQDARRTLEFRTGDCVSKSVCLSTLLASLGIESYFVAQHPSHDQAYSHVYIECRGVALDPIADGKNGRPLFSVGHRQVLPDGGFETKWTIFCCV
jgi:transglutaminase-like putative cysteine protease